MYNHILVAIEHSAADRAVLTHIEQLAGLTGARLLLVHVADGWAARHFDDLKLRESEEIRDDRAYLEQLCERPDRARLRRARPRSRWAIRRPSWSRSRRRSRSTSSPCRRTATAS